LINFEARYVQNEDDERQARLLCARDRLVKGIA
jgi:hypothetical protein